MLSFSKIEWLARFRNLSGRYYIFIIFLFSFYGEAFPQQIEVVDFLKVEATLTPNMAEKSIKGAIKYSFKSFKIPIPFIWTRRILN